MAAGIIPAFFGIIVTYWVAKKLANKGSFVELSVIQNYSGEQFPLLLPAVVAPVTAILLLALRPLFDIVIDPMVALPIGGIVGAFSMGRIKRMNEYAVLGLNKMSPVAIMLLGTGTLAGIIGNSGLKDVVINGLQAAGLPRSEERRVGKGDDSWE